MVESSRQLLKRLEPPVRPAFAGDTRVASRPPIDAAAFGDLLALVASGSDPTGRYIALTFVGFFLIARQYRPWRRLTTAQRALSFFSGIDGLSSDRIIRLTGPSGGPVAADYTKKSATRHALAQCRSSRT